MTNEIFNTLSSDFIQVLVDASVKGIVLFGLAWGAAQAFKKRSAAAKHIVWALAVAGFILLPVMSAILPEWRIPLLSLSASEQEAPANEAWTMHGKTVFFPAGGHAAPISMDLSVFENAPNESVPSTLQTPGEADGRRANPVIPASAYERSAFVDGDVEKDAPWNGYAIGFLVWLLGAAAIVARIGLGHLKVARIGKTAAPIEGEDFKAALETVKQRIGIRYPVSVLESDRISIPITWGVFRPAIVFPTHASEWPEERFQLVLLHELAHVKRLDYLTHIATYAARAFYWFHPLVWIAARCLRKERERACDDFVLQTGANAEEYATSLLDAVKQLREPRRAVIPAVAMARQTNIEGRLLSILDKTKKRTGVSRRALLFSTCAFLLLVSPLASLDLFSASSPAVSNGELKIVDALGDAIPEGTITIDGKKYPFEDGRWAPEDGITGSKKVSIYSPGYVVLSPNLDFPLTKTHEYWLEYTCSLEIVVYHDKEKQNTVSNAEVILWEGPRVQRPVLSELKLSGGTPNGPIERTVRLEKEGFRVIQADDELYAPLKPKQGEYGAVLEGDLIVGVGGCMTGPDLHPVYQWKEPAGWPYFYPYKQGASRRLRAWDALTAHVGCESGSYKQDYLELARGDLWFANYITNIGPSSRGEQLATATTDAHGCCRFENLQAGTYHVQALKGDSRSSLVAIHPAQTGAELFMHESCVLTVRVSKDLPGHQPTLAGKIQNADVQIKSLDGGTALYSDVTGEVGFALFKDFPWGKYVATVTPPPDSNLEPKTQEFEVVDNFCDVDVTYESDIKLYSVSGTIVDANTKKPVERTALFAYRSSDPSGSCGNAVSDNEGRFLFTNLMPGEYNLNLCLDRDHFKGYLAAGRYIHADGWSSMGGNITRDVKVVDENVDGVQFEVIPAVKTRIVGQVVKSDGSPAAGAYVIPKNQMLGFLEADNRADAEGRFDFTIATASDMKEIPNGGGSSGSYGMAGFGGNSSVEKDQAPKSAFTLTACLVEEMQSLDGMTYSGTGGRPHLGRTLAEGAVNIPVALGETAENIKITLHDVDSSHTLVGKITTDSGELPEKMRVSVRQDKDNYPVEVASDGSFEVKGLHPGKVSINVSPYGRKEKIEGFGEVSVGDYCSEKLEVDIPKDVEEVKIDIPLARSGHIAGAAYDDAGKPLDGGNIIANGEKSHGFAKTNRNGKFWIDGLRLGVPHEIRIGERSNDYYGKLSRKNVLPGDDEITIGMQSLKGSVVDANSGQPISGVDVGPLMRVNVSLPIMDMPGRMETDSDGRFYLKCGLPGTYEYIAIKDGFEPAWFSMTAPMEKPIQVELSPSQCSLTVAVTLDGKPWIDKNMVLGLLYDGAQLKSVAQSDPEKPGVYTVTAIKPGKATLFARRQSHEGFLRGYPQEIEIVKGSNNASMELVPMHGFWIILTTQDGKPVGDKVEFAFPDFPELESNAINSIRNKDSFRLEMPQGRHRLIVNVPGYQTVDFYPNDRVDFSQSKSNYQDISIELQPE